MDTTEHQPTPYHHSDENTPLIHHRVDSLRSVVAKDEDCSSSKHFWNEIRAMLELTLPILGTLLLEYCLIITNVISIGHISTAALAAATLGMLTANVTGFGVIQGFVTALDTVLPSAWTSSHPELVGLWSQRMWAIMVVVMIPIFVIWFKSEAIFLLLGQDAEIAHLASLYLRWLSLGLPAEVFNAIARRYFQAQGRVTVPTATFVVIAPLNVFLNWFIVWGPIGIGFIGAPIATAISFNIISLAFVIVAWRNYIKAKQDGSKQAWHPVGSRSFSQLSVLTRLGFAGVGQVASEWWCWEFVGLAASQLGQVPLASESVLVVSAATTYQAPLALSIAVAIRRVCFVDTKTLFQSFTANSFCSVGNLLGEGKAQQAKLASKVGLVLAVFFGVIVSATFFSARHSWGSLFSDDPDVITLVSSVLPLVALCQVFYGLAGFSNGVLRAKGQQGLGAMLNISAYYIVGIPLGIFLAFKQSMGLKGLWVGLTVALCGCALILLWIVLKTDWEREEKKVRIRLEAEAEAEERRQTMDEVERMG
ncbi:hypothetical protein EW146_g3355 [Bondarzewia mesenterica]|uniref:MATE efflux family protein n=1 Tax=Bondarzewia mesenterica TaxID=1095465 RepID=A0A4S4LXU5_9AGAM|nr:hypothetical protein EW146_g3355 [Bondarzewia mesenterica]